LTARAARPPLGVKEKYRDRRLRLYGVLPNLLEMEQPKVSYTQTPSSWLDRYPWVPSKAWWFLRLIAPVLATGVPALILYANVLRPNPDVEGFENLACIASSCAVMVGGGCGVVGLLWTGTLFVRNAALLVSVVFLTLGATVTSIVHV